MAAGDGGEVLSGDDVDGDDVCQDAAEFPALALLAELLSDHQVVTLCARVDLPEHQEFYWIDFVNFYL